MKDNCTVRFSSYLSERKARVDRFLSILDLSAAYIKWGDLFTHPMPYSRAKDIVDLAKIDGLYAYVCQDGRTVYYP